MPCNQYTFFFSPLQDSLLWARDEILHKLWISHAAAPTNKDFQTVDGQYGQKTCFYLSLCKSHLWCRCILLWHKRRQLDDGLNHQKKKHLHDVHFEWQGAAAAPSQSWAKMMSARTWVEIGSVPSQKNYVADTKLRTTNTAWLNRAGNCKNKNMSQVDSKRPHGAFNWNDKKWSWKLYTFKFTYARLSNILSGKVKPFKQVTERMRRCWFFANAVF